MITIEQITSKNKDDETLEYIKNIIDAAMDGSFVSKEFIDYLNSNNFLNNDNKYIKKEHFLKYSADGINLFLIHLRNVLQKEVAKTNFDFNSDDCTWYEYINNIKGLDFDIIGEYKDPENKCDEIIFKHKEFSIFWIIHSYESYVDTNTTNKYASGSRIHFEGTLRNKNEKGYKLQLSRHIQEGTNQICCSIDMRVQASYLLTEIIKTFKIADYMFDFFPYTEKLEKNNVFDNIDSDILDKMFLYHVRTPTENDEKEIEFKYKTEKYEKVNAFLDTLPQSEKERIYNYGSFIGGRFSSECYLPKDIIQKLLDFGFENNEINYVNSQIIFIFYKSNLPNPWNNFKNSFKGMPKEDIIKIMEYRESERSFIEDFNEDEKSIVKELIS